jgi:hypothetical protein
MGGRKRILFVLVTVLKDIVEGSERLRCSLHFEVAHSLWRGLNALC